MHSSETSVLTRILRRDIPEVDILHDLQDCFRQGHSVTRKEFLDTASVKDGVFWDVNAMWFL
jgi:hypothetical protein